MRVEDGPVYHRMREEVYEKTRPPSRAVILTTGFLSVLLSLAVLLPSLLLLVNSNYWRHLHSGLEGWLERPLPALALLGHGDPDPHGGHLHLHLLPLLLRRP